MSTLITSIKATERDIIDNPNVVKVVTNQRNYALYFSRSCVPYDRSRTVKRFHKHIGIYMYSRETLQMLCGMERTPLEIAESLEQLRALENGVQILCVETDYNPTGVDTPEDTNRVLIHLAMQGS